MNKQIPEEYEQRYDIVIDGGALEHIFNLAVALANCMKMLRVGGGFFMFTPANNQLGHGFYQFSPELLFRALDFSHGFKVERMEAMELRYANAELGSVGPIYQVIGPKVLGCRSTVVNSRPLGFFGQALKLTHLKILFEENPQQSDYAKTWATPTVLNPNHAKRPKFSLRKLLGLIFRNLPVNIHNVILNKYNKFYYFLARESKNFYSKKVVLI